MSDLNFCLEFNTPPLRLIPQLSKLLLEMFAGMVEDCIRYCPTVRHAQKRHQ